MYSSKKCTKIEQTQHYNKRLSKEQVRLLEASFKFDSKLDTDRKVYLAQQLGLSARQVAIWYQNKRARSKNQGLEQDFKALKQRLESALANNASLEKEVQRLRQELEEAHKMLVSPTSSSNNNVCDQERSFVGEPCCTLESDLYACLFHVN